MTHYSNDSFSDASKYIYAAKLFIFSRGITGTKSGEKNFAFSKKILGFADNVLLFSLLKSPFSGAPRVLLPFYAYIALPQIPQMLLLLDNAI